MKVNIGFLVAAYATMALSAATSNAAAECGALGVMNYDAKDLPEDVAPEDVRLCADHPLGRDLSLEDASLARMPSNVPCE